MFEHPIKPYAILSNQMQEHQQSEIPKILVKILMTPDDHDSSDFPYLENGPILFKNHITTTIPVGTLVEHVQNLTPIPNFRQSSIPRPSAHKHTYYHVTDKNYDMEHLPEPTADEIFNITIPGGTVIFGWSHHGRAARDGSSGQ